MPGTNRLFVQTYPSNYYGVEIACDLAVMTNQNWQAFTNFQGAPGTNLTELELPATSANAEFYRAFMLVSPFSGTPSRHHGSTSR